MTDRIPAWLEQAAAGHDCGCPHCQQLPATLAHILDVNQAEMDRYAAARINELEREVAALRKQLDALRRQQRERGAA